jgi:hypothetical protein
MRGEQAIKQILADQIKAAMEKDGIEIGHGGAHAHEPPGVALQLNWFFRTFGAGEP